MASVSRDSNGTKRVCFTDGTGKRHVLRLGRVNVRQAEEVRVRVEALLAAKMYRRSPDVELLGWLNGLDDRVHRRFANKGLVPHRERAAGATLESLIKRFLDASTVKPATLAAYKQTTDSLLEVLGRRTPVTEITPADADHWRKAISEKGERRDLVTESEWAGHTIQIMSQRSLRQVNADSASRAAREAASVGGAGVG